MRLPKVELAMFRGLVMMMNADKVQSPVEILAIEKVVARFPHNHKIVQRLISVMKSLCRSSTTIFRMKVLM